MSAGRVILLGWDGATFGLLGPMMRGGLMPNLCRMMEKGVWGNLSSIIPPNSPADWTTCLTGLNPGGHGVFDFVTTSGSGKPNLVSSHSIRAPSLWEILNRDAISTGIINVPVTYPPTQVNGFVVAGMMTPDSGVDYTFPPELKVELVSNIGDYVPDLDIEMDFQGRPVMEWLDGLSGKIRYHLRMRREALFYLMEKRPCDLVVVVFEAMDRIQHFLWKYLHPEEGMYHEDTGKMVRDRVIPVYTELDAILGHLIPSSHSGDVLILLSDHGFGPLRAWLNMERILGEMGLIRNGDSWDLPYLNGYHCRFSSKATQGIIVQGDNDSNPKKDRPSYGYRSFCDILKQRLEGLTEEGIERPLFDRVLFKGDVFKGPYANLGPDILMVSHDYAYICVPGDGKSPRVIDAEGNPGGFHRLEGIFAGVGGDFQGGVELKNISILDITPTILRLFDIPVPDYMEGRDLRTTLSKNRVKGTGESVQEIKNLTTH